MEMVNKKEIHEFFTEMESSGVASFAPENVISVITNPLAANEEEEELEESLIREMPHYQIGYSNDTLLDLELETCKTPEEVKHRLYIIASGGSFESKNKGYFFSISDSSEREGWIRSLQSDRIFQRMVKSAGLDPKIAIAAMIDVSKKSG